MRTLLWLLLSLIAFTIDAFQVPQRTVERPISPKGNPPTVFVEKDYLSIFDRLNTLRAAGFEKPKDKMVSPMTKVSIGFLGHAGLMVLSTVVVSLVKRLFVSAPAEPQQAGILNRCPWPFIFFHDPKQGLKDAPTWVVVLYLVLWRASKLVVKAKAA